MNTVKRNAQTATDIGAVSGVERVARTVIGFAGFLAVLLDIATTPLQYFALSALGIYLVHTAIIGLDPFYAATQYVRSKVKSKGVNLSIPAHRAQ